MTRHVLLVITLAVLGAPWTYAQERPVRNRSVYELERALARMGFDPGPVDGVYDRATADALRMFQRKRGLPASGRPDRATMRALGLD